VEIKRILKIETLLKEKKNTLNTTRYRNHGHPPRRGENKEMSIGPGWIRDWRTKRKHL